MVAPSTSGWPRESTTWPASTTPYRSTATARTSAPATVSTAPVARAGTRERSSHRPAVMASSTNSSGLTAARFAIAPVPTPRARADSSVTGEKVSQSTWVAATSPQKATSRARAPAVVLLGASATTGGA